MDFIDRIKDKINSIPELPLKIKKDIFLLTKA